MSGVIAMILAGGEGTRLQPLTVTRSKPAVPFGGSYRLIDFVLNNFVNSDIIRIFVLTQFKSQSLFMHMKKGWAVSGIQGVLSTRFQLKCAWAKDGMTALQTLFTKI